MSNKVKENMIQELYDALNVNFRDLIESPYKVKNTSQLRYARAADLLERWVKEYKKENPDFTLTNRLKERKKEEGKGDD